MVVEVGRWQHTSLGEGQELRRARSSLDGKGGYIGAYIPRYLCISIPFHTLEQFIPQSNFHVIEGVYFSLVSSGFIWFMVLTDRQTGPK